VKAFGDAMERRTPKAVSKRQGSAGLIDIISSVLPKPDRRR
jgi:hypothetical protein